MHATRSLAELGPEYLKQFGEPYLLLSRTSEGGVTLPDPGMMWPSDETPFLFYNFAPFLARKSAKTPSSPGIFRVRESESTVDDIICDSVVAPDGLTRLEALKRTPLIRMPSLVSCRQKVPVSAIVAMNRVRCRERYLVITANYEVLSVPTMAVPGYLKDRFAKNFAPCYAASIAQDEARGAAFKADEEWRPDPTMYGHRWAEDAPLAADAPLAVDSM